jgi:hypothetical protein
MSNGRLNPTQAMSVWIWMKASYNYQFETSTTSGTPPVTVWHIYEWFSYYKYGNFMWLYILAPYLAAIPAGLLA